MIRILFITLLAAALSARSADQRTLDVVVDVVQFRGEGASTRWEFQYSFADTALRYVIAPSGFQAEMLCRVNVVSALGDTLRDEWIASAASTVQKPIHQRFYAGVRKLQLAPGNYKVTFNARDMHDDTRILSSTFSSTVQAFTFKPSMSDVMFVTPRALGSDARFDRNGESAQPNPRHEIIGRDPSICFYTEIYNARRANLDTFALEFQVLDHVREEQLVTYLREIGTSDGLVVREEIPAGALRSGVYTLRTRMLSKDLVTVYDMKEERIFVLNPEFPPEGRLLVSEDEQFQVSEWSVVTDERLVHELELSDVLASRAEMSIRASCTDTRSKQRYLFKFWRQRDPDPSTFANERLDDFRAMYKRAQSFYGNPTFRNGWKTDRGLALLRYGIPTQVEQFIQTIDTKPYEIWFYQGIQGGAHFYFVDMNLQQNHRLVHSTMIGQIREPNWYNLYCKAFEPNPIPLESLRPSQR